MKSQFQDYTSTNRTALPSQPHDLVEPDVSGQYQSADQIPLPGHSSASGYYPSSTESTWPPYNAPAFQHHTLIPGTNHVRLLLVDPLKDYSNYWEPPQCQIYTIDLESTPKYLALSYTWGDATPCYPIYLNGGTYKVRENLYHFLCHFRSDSVNQPGTYIWIDQICINQTDLSERSYTVKYTMPMIFWKATYVITWLGRDDSMVSAAMSFKRTRSTESLATLLCNRFFTRLWIIQEVLLGRLVYVLCGNVWISYLEMEETARDKQEFLRRRIDHTTSLYLLWDSVHNRNGRHLAQCIERYSSNDCENPRDRVYALLGLVKQEEQVYVDYTKSVPEVFVDALRVLAGSYYSLSGIHSGPHALPYNYGDIGYLLATHMGFSAHQLHRLQYYLSETDAPPEWFDKVLRFLLYGDESAYQEEEDDNQDDDDDADGDEYYDEEGNKAFNYTTSWL